MARTKKSAKKEPDKQTKGTQRRGPKTSQKTPAVISKPRNISKRQEASFPVQKIFEMMKRMHREGTVQPDAALYLAGVMMYIATEVLETTGAAARETACKTTGDVEINEAAVERAIFHDKELRQLLKSREVYTDEEASRD